MTELCFIRHGQTDWNARELTQGSSDIPLNETGRDQARATAELIADERWDAIYTSPLSRAAETAAIIAARLGLPDPSPRADLRERAFGEAEGLDIVERKARFQGRPVPGAEPWDDVLIRSIRALETIRDDEKDRRVIVVAHGGVINALLKHLSGGELGPGKTILRNASASLFVWDGSWRVAWYNRTAEVASTITENFGAA
jgi:uncharacterized phosphatase